MSRNIKIIFGALGFAAVLSAVFLVDYLTHGSVRSFVDLDSLKSNFSLAIDTDADKDGLSDSDESYWNTDFQNPDTDGDGFIDGEEVASGRDPTLAGPDDKLFPDNLTEKVSTLTLSGLVEGSLKPDNPEFSNSLDTLSLSIIQDGLESLEPTDQLNIIVIQSGPEETRQYASRLEDNLTMFFKQAAPFLKEVESKLALFSTDNSSSELNLYFGRQAREFDRIYDTWTQTPVPEDWKENHIAFAEIIKRFSTINIALSQGKDDPVRASIAFTALIDLVDQMTKVMTSIDQKLLNEKL